MGGGDAQPTSSSKRIRFKRWAKRVGRRLLSPFRKGDSKDITVPAQTGDVAEEDTEEEASLSPAEDALPTNEESIQPMEETVTPTTDGAASNSRQIAAANGVDLSGSWRPIVTSQFKSEYDAYLQKCGQPFLFRKTVVNGIQLQKETIRQLNGGEYLEIVATNPIGDWNRTLVASSEVKPVCWPITDPDADIVQVESWWEGNGTRHKSVLRDKPNVNGGVFETVRYLEGEDVLVCDSSFLPSPDDAKREYGNVIWRFKRVDR